MSQRVSLKGILLHIFNMLQKVMAYIRFRYVNLIRVGLGQATHPKIDDIHVLYKSDNFVVVNKIQDIKINSNSPEDVVTVASQLSNLYPEHVDKTVDHNFRFIHRLDYATSGALCIALNKKSSQWGSKAFQKRYVTKHYLALLRGHVPLELSPINIEDGIGEDSSVTDVNRMCVESHPACCYPRTASTTLILLEHGTYAGEPASKVLLIPHTGRTHQLRVHSAQIGHLVVGDYTYSNRQDIRPYRMMLHAHRIVIPMKHEHIDVTAPDPFTNDKDSKWLPHHVYKTYKDYVEAVNLQSLEYRNINKPKEKKLKGKIKKNEDNDMEKCFSDVDGRSNISAIFNKSIHYDLNPKITGNTKS